MRKCVFLTIFHRILHEDTEHFRFGWMVCPYFIWRQFYKNTITYLNSYWWLVSEASKIVSIYFLLFVLFRWTKNVSMENVPYICGPKSRPYNRFQASIGAHSLIIIVGIFNTVHVRCTLACSGSLSDVRCVRALFHSNKYHLESVLDWANNPFPIRTANNEYCDLNIAHEWFRIHQIDRNEAEK